MYERFVEPRVEEALADTPVILIVGPRRAGKTTLVRKMGKVGRTYITLDDQTTLDAAQSDPAGFIRGLDQAIIDEIQRAPNLLLAIKKSVDEDYRPGRFLLTGSANVLTLPRVADSLAGRMETIRMLPLARAESETDWLRCPCLLCGAEGRTAMPKSASNAALPTVFPKVRRHRRVAWSFSMLSAPLQISIRWHLDILGPSQMV